MAKVQFNEVKGIIEKGAKVASEILKNTQTKDDVRQFFYTDEIDSAFLDKKSSFNFDSSKSQLEYTKKNVPVGSVFEESEKFCVSMKAYRNPTSATPILAIEPEAFTPKK